MKKIATIILIFFVSLILVACNAEEQIPTDVTLFNAMSTTFNVTIYRDEDDLETIKIINNVLVEIKETLEEIHILTDNFETYENDGVPVKNISYINNNTNQKIEINKELYNIVKLAEQYKEEFDGYFDISVGLIIDEWKKLINLDETIFNKDDKGNVVPLSEEQFNAFLNNVKAIPIINNGIILTNEAGRYLIEIKDGVKIDLGAIAKGYVVDLITKLIKEAGIINFKVEGSESSLEFGQNPNREGEIFKVGIRSTNPFQFTDIVDVKNIAIATSGDTVQTYIHKGIKYHHIISPVTKMPESYRSLVTIIGHDSAKLDALTTALMSMPDEKFNEFVEKYPNYTIYNIK